MPGEMPIMDAGNWITVGSILASFAFGQGIQRAQNKSLKEDVTGIKDEVKEVKGETSGIRGEMRELRDFVTNGSTTGRPGLGSKFMLRGECEASMKLLRLILKAKAKGTEIDEDPT